jgi:hypothetical protein
MEAVEIWVNISKKIIKSLLSFSLGDETRGIKVPGIPLWRHATSELWRPGYVKP